MKQKSKGPKIFNRFAVKMAKIEKGWKLTRWKKLGTFTSTKISIHIKSVRTIYYARNYLFQIYILLNSLANSLYFLQLFPPHNHHHHHQQPHPPNFNFSFTFTHFCISRTFNSFHSRKKGWVFEKRVGGWKIKMP